MCGSPSAPAPPPVVAEAAVAPDTSGNMSAAERDKRRRAAASGDGRSTILTGSRGVEAGATTATKTLLGQ